MSIGTIIKTAGIGVRVGGKFIAKNLPTILTAVGTVGVVAGTILAAKKAPEAKVELDKEKQDWKKKTPEEKEKLGKAYYVFRIIKVGGRYYGIVCLVVAGSIVCFWLANHIHLKRAAAMAAGMKIMADQMKDEENFIKKKFGKNEVDKAKDEANMEKNKDIHVDPEMASRLNHIIGECVVWDPIMKHPFISSADRIRRAIGMAKSDLEEQLLEGEKYAFLSYSDFLDWCGCDIRGPSYMNDGGTYLGFAVEALNGIEPNKIHQAAEDAVDVSWTSDMLEGEIPVLALKFGNPPRHCYYKG